MKSVSVCIPCFNQVDYLKETIDSVLQQTYPITEIIISDDSTTNAVEQLVHRYSDSISQKIIYVRNSPSLGPAANWNQCIRMANSEWVKIIHHDDWFSRKDSLALFMDAATDEIPFVFSASVSKNEREKTLTDHFPSSGFLQSLKENPAILFNGNLVGPPSAILFRKDLAIFFDERMKWLVDIDFYIQILQKTKGKFNYIPEPLITSVSYASHNVTNSCNTAETELYEYFLLFEKLKRSQINNEKTIDRVVALLVKYDVRSIEKLKPFLRDVSLAEEEIYFIFKKVPRKGLRASLKSLFQRRN
jgi:glycosyltransferase involved in cell wall biosynthesis